ncbi:MAG TPA: hypothetical protein VMY78_09950 [Solirubrobacteraceae bacterium]|nr:hypothetical protein [Solirubrobacteraceae bacterium]
MSPQPRKSPPQSPQDSQQESPSPSLNGAPASSPASEPASTSGGGAFVADPGPAFDPAGAPEPDPTAFAPELVDLGWEEEQVRSLLEAQGVVLHTVAAIDKDSAEWLYTATELRAIAGPLTRILNTYDVTRAAAGSADPLILMVGLSGYVTRSYSERRRLLAELVEQPPVPITGLQPDEPIAPATGQEAAASWST